MSKESSSSQNLIQSSRRGTITIPAIEKINNLFNSKGVQDAYNFKELSAMPEGDAAVKFTDSSVTSKTPGTRKSKSPFKQRSSIFNMNFQDMFMMQQQQLPSVKDLNFSRESGEVDHGRSKNTGFEPIEEDTPHYQHSYSGILENQLTNKSSSSCHLNDPVDQSSESQRRNASRVFYKSGEFLQDKGAQHFQTMAVKGGPSPNAFLPSRVFQSKYSNLVKRAREHSAAQLELQAQAEAEKKSKTGDQLPMGELAYSDGKVLDE